MGSIPFTAEEFLRLFETYNNAIWPMQIIAYLLAGLAIFLTVKRTAISRRLIGLVLAFFWLWMGIVYNLIFFTALNRAAYGFGTAFIVQALLFLVICVWKDRVSYGPRPDIYTFTGAIFILYAMVVYPVLGRALGHPCPSCPAFGVTPCPTTIFTFGLLLFAGRRVPWYLLIVPLLWSLVGFQAAFFFTILEDFALPAVAVLGTVMILIRNRMLRRLAT
ncbi:MAG: DUF6064 family protein [bacterium]|jgi:hypothetical protein